MKSQWPLQEAKNRLSHLVEQARVAGPQTITVRGREKAVLVSVEEYQRLTRPSLPLTAFFRQSPLVGADLDSDRSTDTGRHVEL